MQRMYLRSELMSFLTLYADADIN